MRSFQSAAWRFWWKLLPLVATQAPLLTDTTEKLPPLRLYVDQLEKLAQRVMSGSGPEATQAKRVLSPENQTVLGLEPGRPTTGKFKLVDIRPTLKDRCPNTSTGVHQVFQEGRRAYCRACGTEEMTKP